VGADGARFPVPPSPDHPGLAALARRFRHWVEGTRASLENPRP